MEDTTNLALTGEPWGVFRELFERSDHVTMAPHCTNFQELGRKTQFVRQQHFVQVSTIEERQWSALLTICEGNPPITAGLPQQMANNAENVSITWRVHDIFWLGSRTDDRQQILSSTV